MPLLHEGWRMSQHCEAIKNPRKVQLYSHTCMSMTKAQMESRRNTFLQWTDFECFALKEVPKNVLQLSTWAGRRFPKQIEMREELDRCPSAMCEKNMYSFHLVDQESLQLLVCLPKTKAHNGTSSPVGLVTVDVRGQSALLRIKKLILITLSNRDYYSLQ